MSRFALLIALSTVAAGAADAKCFAFRGEDIKVCVDGSDNSARSQAESVCESVTGNSCSISGSSGECRKSGSTTCYDGEGNEHSHLTADFSLTGPGIQAL